MLLLVIPDFARHRPAPPLTRGLIHRRLDRHHLARLHVHANLLARLHLITRNVHGALIDLDVSMANQLSRCLTTGGEAESIDHVVETTLESSEEIVSCDAWQ